VDAAVSRWQTAARAVALSTTAGALMLYREEERAAFLSILSALRLWNRADDDVVVPGPEVARNHALQVWLRAGDACRSHARQGKAPEKMEALVRRAEVAKAALETLRGRC
jgi:transcription termination factor Rho